VTANSEPLHVPDLVGYLREAIEPMASPPAPAFVEAT
jgi:hypothetical protein